jgi:hypothetical protein
MLLYSSLQYDPRSGFRALMKAKQDEKRGADDQIPGKHLNFFFFVTSYRRYEDKPRTFFGGCAQRRRKPFTLSGKYPAGAGGTLSCTWKREDVVGGAVPHLP